MIGISKLYQTLKRHGRLSDPKVCAPDGFAGSAAQDSQRSACSDVRSNAIDICRQQFESSTGCCMSNAGGGTSRKRSKRISKSRSSKRRVVGLL